MTQQAELAHALQAIADRCDQAATDDGEGFSSGDVPLGHFLAQLPLNDWNADCTAFAYQLVHHYRGQLERHGIDTAAIPQPDGHDQPGRELREALYSYRETLRRRDALARAFCETTAVADEELLMLVAPAEEDLVAAARQIPGDHYRRHYLGHDHVRLFPLHSAAEVAALCRRFGIRMSDRVLEFAANPPPPPAPDLDRVRLGDTWLRATDLALRAEGVLPQVRQRVRNWLLYGDPEPFVDDVVATVRPSEWERLYGERPAPPLTVPEAERRAHRCDEQCVCALDGLPAYYVPASGEHACQDPDCPAAGGVDA